MLNFLRKSKIKNILENMGQLVGAYVKVAMMDSSSLKKSRNPQHPLPIELSGIQNLRNVAVTTSHIPILPDSSYSKNIVSIDKFETTFQHVGGVNLPKKTVCYGSNGKSYPQLIKGNDDLRQDAVMEQVFGMVNDLLKQNTETRKRNLSIRTYKVIPLSPNAGLLEWVDNTLPLRLYLVEGPKQ